MSCKNLHVLLKCQQKSQGVIFYVHPVECLFNMTMRNEASFVESYKDIVYSFCIM